VATITSEAKPTIVNALSVDVEEYFHALIFREGTNGAAGGSLESRVEASTERVLALLASGGAKATFFVLGEVARAHPALVRKIAGESHEIACHGDRHELVSRQTPPEFRADVRDAKAVLEDITGAPVVGYRAPNFSIGRAQTWAYDILLEEGFRYDSSSYPILHDRYGDRAAPRFPYEISRKGDQKLTEFPIGTTRLLGVNFPIGGGGYFRLFPLALTRRGIRRVNDHERQPILFYFHPWELDPDQPRPVMPWRHRVRLYIGMGREERKLSRLLRDFEFTTARNVLGI
jgi:polysaccharide deacetylase family protein (PEP-CTERM system associated)